jgi:predicted TIM-barrel fold metal-dependent hydrolase
MLNHGKCVGIKLHPGAHKYDFTEFGDDIFAFASEYGAIVKIHPTTSCIEFVSFADKYPDVTFILAHLSSPDFANAINTAKHRNIYTDTSSSSSSLNHAVEYTVEQGCADRILFGTDTYAAGFQRGRIEYALISEEDKASILRNNAMRLFGRFL